MYRPEMSLPESIAGWKGRGASRPEAGAGQDLEDASEEAPPPDIASGGYGRREGEKTTGCRHHVGAPPSLFEIHSTRKTFDVNAITN